MKEDSSERLNKKIKKNLFGKTQTAYVFFPAGFAEIALAEVHHILSTLWFPQKETGECALVKNAIRIDHIHFFALIELLLRSRCCTDIRLVIFKGKAVGKKTFEKKCRDVHWDFFINKKMSVKIKVNSVASFAFHESGLKEILSDILSEYANDIVGGETANETTRIDADLYHDKLTLTISLAGMPLYKRGYRGVLSHSAPLREDIAACCVQAALQFGKKKDENFFPETLLVPFAGTGTFAFEYLLSYLDFPPALFPREYALQKMPLFREEHFHFLLKKAKEQRTSVPLLPEIFCIDRTEDALRALAENKEIFKKSMEKNSIIFSEKLFFIENNNFFAVDFSQRKMGNIFIPLNPPYGLRLGKKTETTVFYKQIANKINEIAEIATKNKKNVLGLILCSSETSWMAFIQQLRCARMETYHCTQGGLDIRVCQFFV